MIGDFHTHTVFSDGDNTPEEMVKAAIAKGMDKIGFSDHSYTFFDEQYCVQKDRISAYRSEINVLKEKYRGKIDILCGIEQDFYSAEPVDGYDYAIGSVHYLKLGGEYLPVDESGEFLQKIVERLGGTHAFFKEYFDTVSAYAERPDIGIIGHFDYLTVFNDSLHLFDEHDEVYQNLAKAAIDKLMAAGKIFEINTGGIVRGYHNAPYPSVPLIEYIISKGGKLILSSDSHRTETLCSKFEDFRKYAAIESV